MITPGRHGAAEIVACADRRSGVTVELLIDGAQWMSDSDYERETNRKVMERAFGRVLIGGLGLGMIVAPLLAADRVESITVIERSADVIALVEPYLRGLSGGEKLKVIHGDVFEVDAPGPWDSVYLDIWGAEPLDVRERDYRRLLSRVKLNPGALTGYWRG